MRCDGDYDEFEFNLSLNIMDYDRLFGISQLTLECYSPKDEHVLRLSITPSVYLSHVETNTSLKRRELRRLRYYF